MSEAETDGNRSLPYMELANYKFMLSLPEFNNDSTLQNKLMAGIKEGDMAPFYSTVCADLGWELNEDLLSRMQGMNREKLSQFEKDDNEKGEDENEPRLWLDKLEYMSSIGDKETALKLATDKSQDTSLSTNCRLDAIFAIFRIAYFHGCDIKLMKSAIEKATELIESRTGTGGDWSARNKLKAYEAVCCLGLRNYSRAADLLLDSVPTFESYELLDFSTLIRYTMIACMIALPRCEFSTKLRKNGALTQALHAQPDLKKFYENLYEGQYMEFFVVLAKIETAMRRDKLLHPHYRHYVREMKLKAYSQLLQAYRSLSLKSMAEAFGVTEEYIEKEVSRFAALGRLQCKIDSVAGTVVTSGYLNEDAGICGNVVCESAPEATYERGVMYQVTIKHGDILLNRLKKLARVMDF
ncbi:26S proteasome non-ATPase regulatory subunit 6 [Blattella germanica]|nr:26S proteasome non-ATPase regulatory subunit 6 [Blattella germanica]